jgi:fluoride exporter
LRSVIAMRAVRSIRELMSRLLLIGFAGALGTVARYLIGTWAARTLGTGFPYGTLIVNIVGCFLIAAVMRVALTTSLVPETLRLTLVTGFMGGLTTYSAFNYETSALFRERGLGVGLLNVGVTVGGCLVAGLLGLVVGQRFAGPAQ